VQNSRDAINQGEPVERQALAKISSGRAGDGCRRMTLPDSTNQLHDYFRLMEQQLPHVRRGNLRFQLAELSRDVDLRGRSVLDIGAGDGQLSLFAASAGASKVVALEPEAAGSSAGMFEKFDRLAGLLGLEDLVKLRPVTLQAYDPGGERFDVLILNASVNHLDEDACIRLHRDNDARAAYRIIFAKLAALAAPGARLIVSDCSRHNLFAHLGVRNPISRSIEWHKHQTPQVWAALLEEQGFRRLKIRWESFNSLRTPGKVLLGNRIASYMLTSAFCLTMELA
jgi:2-polyprenyl-3-methyl-5-hydroxy-6-metoxy-1,4-benzoquinol methylase